MDSVSIIESRKLSSANPFLLFMKVFLTNGATVCVVNNTEDVVYNGDTYTRFALNGQVYRASKSGEMPIVALKIDDTTQVISSAIRPLKGASGSTIYVYVVNASGAAYISGTLTMALPASKTFAFQVVSTTIDDSDHSITFNLGAPNLLTQRFLSVMFTADYCGWIFRGHECTYVDPTAGAVVVSGSFYVCMFPHVAALSNHPVTASDYDRLRYWRLVRAYTASESPAMGMIRAYNSRAYQCIKAYALPYASDPASDATHWAALSASPAGSWTLGTAYTAGTATCGRTLAACRAYGLSRRFCGKKGLSHSNLRVA